MEGLGFAERGVMKVWMHRAEIACTFVESITPHEFAGWDFEYAVFGIEFVDRRAPARRVSLAEHLLKITMEQFVDSVIHKSSDA